MRKLIIAVALLAFASPVTAQERVFEEPYWTDRPVIEALGRAKLELPPNRASFDVSFVETNKDTKKAMQLAVERARAAYDAIKAVAGADSRIQTSVNVSPYYEQYRQKDGDRVENRRADKVKGYEARASVRVTMTNVELAGKARAAALALAPEQSGQLSVRLERTAEVSRQAYEAAVRDAAARARASANAAGAPLGKLLVLQEGNGPCLGQWTTQPGVIARRRSAYAPSPSPEPAPRLQSVTVTAATIGGKDVIITEEDIAALNLPSDDAPQFVQSQVCAVYAVGD